MESKGTSARLILRFDAELKDPKGMEKFLNFLDKKISRIEKKRLKGMKVSSNEVTLLNAFFLVSAFFIINSRHSQTLKKKHDWLGRRLARFSHLGTKLCGN